MMDADREFLVGRISGSRPRMSFCFTLKCCGSLITLCRSYRTARLNQPVLMVGRETQVVGTWKICLSLCCFVMHERIKRRKWSFMMFVTLLLCHARENKEKKVVSIIFVCPPFQLFFFYNVIHRNVKLMTMNMFLYKPEHTLIPSHGGA